MREKKEREIHMKVTANLNFIFAVLLAFILVLALPACTPSTPETQATAAPTSASPEQDGESKPTTEPSQAPTNTSAPTAVPPTPTPQPEPLKITAQGFGQWGRQTICAFLVENANSGFAIDGTVFTATAYDADGNILDEGMGYRLGLILPGQTLGATGALYIEEGVVVDKIEIELIEGEAVPSDLTSPLAVDADLIRYFPAESEFSSASVTGVITNLTDRMYEYIEVHAVAYNDAGDIIGGGKGTLNIVPASGAVGIEMSLYAAGEPARVELYPTLWDYDEFTREVDQDQTLVLVKQGFGQNSAGDLGYAAIVQNPSSDNQVAFIHITLYADDGSVAGVGGFYVTLTAGQTLGLANNTSSIPEGVSIARADFLLSTQSTSDPDEYYYFPAEFIFVQNVNGFIRVTGEFTNPMTQEINNAQVMAIAYNDAGEIIGAGSSWVDIPANATAESSFNLIASAEPATVELYAIKNSTFP